MRRSRAVAAAAIVSIGCATLADGEAGLDNPPSARAGPFRLFRIGEIGQERAAPYVMDDQDVALRDASVIDADGDPKTPGVEGYFAASMMGAAAGMPPSSIVRVLAPDGRSFLRTYEPILAAERAWEAGTIGAPSALLLGRTRRIYYAGGGGIGLCESTDGAPFTAGDAPVLDAAGVPWADGPPRSPGVARLPDDRFVMFFEADRGGRQVIGMAESADGVIWTADTSGPTITPGPAGTLDERFVGSPQPVVATSAQGRSVLYVYYAARGADDKQIIAMAASFLDLGEIDLVRSESAMFTPSSRVDPREPSVVRFETFTFLFVSQLRGPGQTDVVTAAGVSPGSPELPPAQ
jgi:hypothetical protein